MDFGEVRLPYYILFNADRYQSVHKNEFPSSDYNLDIDVSHV